MSDSQRIAVTHGEGPVLVLAGPGSGKTFTITNRISYLIDHFQVEPSRILVVTFTKEAAVHMQTRFQSMHEKKKPVNFGTFHAIFYQILKHSGYKTDAILSNSEKLQICIPLLKKYKRQWIEKYQKQTEDFDITQDEMNRCLQAIGYYKNTGDLKKSSVILSAPFCNSFKEIYDQYEKKRIQSAKLDFDDMLYQCFQMLQKDSKILEFWQNKFQYVLIDEFQDINPVQYQIIKLLAAPQNNLFAVGDDDQSIYSFRGSEPLLMQEFIKDYPGCKQVNLNINYRSCPEIVKASLTVINENNNRFVKELYAIKDSCAEEESIVPEWVPAVVIKDFMTKEEQYRYMIDVFHEMTIQQLEQTAVLFRTNAQMQLFAGILSKHSVPHVMKEKCSYIYDHFIMKDIKAYLLFAGGVTERKIFLQIMNKPFRHLGTEALEKEDVNLEDISIFYQKYSLPQFKEVIQRNIHKLEKDLLFLGNCTPYLGICYIRKAMGYESYLKSKAGADTDLLNQWIEMLEFFTKEADTFTTYESWFRYQEDHYIQFKNKQQDKIGEQIIRGIQLMTIHASKGLEFECVWIPDINEGTYPCGHLLTIENIEEERRILYVAMTRAKKNLVLSYVTGTKERPRLSSRFLNTLLDKNDYSSSTISSNSQLSRYSSNASATRSYSSSSSMNPNSGSSFESSGFSL